MVLDLAFHGPRLSQGRVNSRCPWRWYIGHESRPIAPDDGQGLGLDVMELFFQLKEVRRISNRPTFMLLLPGADTGYFVLEMRFCAAWSIGSLSSVFVTDSCRVR